MIIAILCVLVAILFVLIGIHEEMEDLNDAVFNMKNKEQHYTSFETDSLNNEDYDEFD